MPLEDLVDRRDGHIDLMEALEIEANADRPVLALRADAEDQGHNVRWRREVGFPRSGLEILQPLESVLSIAAEPRVELATGDSEESARSTDIARDLLEVLNPPEPRLRLPKLLLFRLLPSP